MGICIKPAAGIREGLGIIRAIHERYHPGKRNPYNEVECGDHYARAMASYGAFVAACGFEYHGPRGFLAFLPKISPDRFKAAFTAAEGWGSIAQTRQGATQRSQIAVRHGRLAVERIELSAPPCSREGEPVVVAELDGASLPLEASIEGERLRVVFPRRTHVGEGQTLTISARPRSNER